MAPFSSLTTMAPALRSRNFRLFWFGQLVSTVGTSLQVLAEGWLIYQITDSTFWLGAVGFIGLLPVVPISLLGGILIDRLPRRKLILATQAGLLLQAAVFAALALSDALQLWHLIALYFVFGALLAVDHPARRAFLVDLVPRADLANAVALNATLFNVSTLIGFALGGALLAKLGPGGTMLINATTYVFPITALLLIRMRDVGQDSTSQRIGAALSEGVAALRRQPAVLAAVGLMAAVGGLAYPVVGLMPAYARDLIGTDEVGLGVLLACSALGSIVGTGVTARVGGQRRGQTLWRVSLLLPLVVIGVALARTFWLACVLVALVGLLLLILQSLAITLVQVNIADRVRGRVMSLYSMLHAGADTGGNLVIGALAVPIGLTGALAAGAGVALALAVGLGVAVAAVRRLE